MSGSTFLLDTNIVIAFFNKEKDVIHHIENSEKIMIPIIVLGELYYGAMFSEKKINNVKRITELQKVTSIVTCSALTALEYGNIKKELRQNGTPIPENDIWIASLAKELNLPLVTRDKHFQYIKNIEVVVW